MNPALLALLASLLAQNLKTSEIVITAQTETGEDRETVLSALRSLAK